MVAVHVGPTDKPDLAGRLYAVPHGRASLLFALIAGVGVSLLARSRSTTIGEARLRLLWRALVLLPFGLALQPLGHGVNVILQDYAVLFVLAVALLTVADRWLLVLAAASATLGSVGYLLGQAVTPGTFDRTGTAFGQAPADIMHGLVLSGPYPLITWAAPFLVGMWLGRLDLRSSRLRTWLVAGGGAVAVSAFLLARGLLLLVGEPTAPGDLRWLVTTVPHSQMPLWLVGGTGFAAFVLGLALVAADRARRLLWPAAAAGQLALTMYVGHLLALHAAPDLLRSDDLGGAVVIVAGFAAAMAVIAVAWRTMARYGPLELALHAPWLATSQPASDRSGRQRAGFGQPYGPPSR